MSNNSRVYIGDLSREANEDDIRFIFERYGTIRNVWVARNPPGFAFVEFDNADDAQESIKNLNGT